jgi:hypothetical protein
MKNQCAFLIIAMMVVSGLQAQKSSSGIKVPLHSQSGKNPSLAGFMQQQEGNLQRSMLLASVDAGIQSIVSPTGTVCDSTFIPSVVLKNYGSETLTSVTLHWQVDGGPVSSQAWTGNLNSLATDTVTFPVQNLTTGTHNFIAYTANPNGTADGDAANDTLTSSFRNGYFGQPGPFYYDFSDTTWPPADWQIDNPDESYTWEFRSDVGRNGLGCVMMNNYSYDVYIEPDDFTLPVMDLSNLVSANLTFDVAYKSMTEFLSDELVVMASSDCGTTWTEIYYKYAPDLATGTPTFLETPFAPADTNWRNETVSLDSFVGNPGVWIKFRNISNYENNLYIDNIRIGTITAVEDALPVNAMRVYPNPSNGIFSVQLNLPETNHARLSVFNAVGQEVMIRDLTPSMNGKISLDLSTHAAGVYYIRLDLDGRSVVKRLSLQ